MLEQTLSREEHCQQVLTLNFCCVCRPPPPPILDSVCIAIPLQQADILMRGLLKSHIIPEHTQTRKHFIVLELTLFPDFTGNNGGLTSLMLHIEKDSSSHRIGLVCEFVPQPTQTIIHTDII